jgi:hypothetical protein
MTNKMDEVQLKMLMNQSDEAVASGLLVMLGLLAATQTTHSRASDEAITKEMNRFMTGVICDIRAAEKLKWVQETRAEKGKAIAESLADALTGEEIHRDSEGLGRGFDSEVK